MHSLKFSFGFIAMLEKMPSIKKFDLRLNKCPLPMHHASSMATFELLSHAM